MTYGALHSTKLLDEGRYEEALARASEEVVTMPDEPEALFNRGQAHAGLGRHEEAVEDYVRSLSLDASASALDPATVDDELFHSLRILAEARRERPEEAVKTLERYRGILPAGRHVGELPTWIDHLRGVEAVWVRNRA